MTKESKETKRFGTNKELFQYLKGAKEAELIIPDYKEPKKTGKKKEE